MNRVRFAIRVCLCLAAVFSIANFARAASRPNIVWILSEDNSMHYLRLYGAEQGATPAIDQLAKEGVTFEHAFSNCPVCSVARTTLMTGMLAPRVGFQYHRKSELARLPKGSDLWPAYMRKAGYYTTNSSKKDYNVFEGKVWDESSARASWRHRPDSKTPFFHMQTFGQSHESSLHFNAQAMQTKTKNDPAKVKLADYHPDTPTFRYTHARYFDRMEVIDAEVGKLCARLKEDGLWDDTIIFYFGDHGGVLPGSKGYAREAGLHVPLVVRVPEKWQSVLPMKPGTRANGFVSFIDFGPSVMNAAGVAIPDTIDGTPFLGESLKKDDIESRDSTYGYADRFDEKYDHVRWIRKGRFSYMRSYQGFYPDGLQNNYRYRMLAFEEWRQLYKQGTLNEAQRQFHEPRAPEQLFDVESDPHEVRNLAGDKKYAAKLKEMRELLVSESKSINDLSVYPESYLVDNAISDGVTFGADHSKEISRLIDVADLALVSFDEAKGELESSLAAKNPWERYQALIVCSNFGEAASSLTTAAKKLLEDDTLLVRVRAAEFLSIIGAADPRPTIYDALAKSDSPVETLLIFNTVVYLRDGKPGVSFDIDPEKVRSRGGEVSRRLEYLTGVKAQQKKRRGKKKPSKAK